LVGMNLLTFQGAIREIRDCATRIESLTRTQLIHDATIEFHLPAFVGLRGGPTLARTLREYADQLKLLASLLGPKRKLKLHVWKANVVALVIEDTKRPYAPQVTALISAVLDDDGYSERAHQQWRLTHQNLIEAERKRLRRFKLSPPPTTPER